MHNSIKLTRCFGMASKVSTMQRKPIHATICAAQKKEPLPSISTQVTTHVPLGDNQMKYGKCKAWRDEHIKKLQESFGEVEVTTTDYTWTVYVQLDDDSNADSDYGDSDDGDSGDCD